MHKSLLKLIAIFLLLATLLPFATACVNDPPPPDDDEDEELEEVEVQSKYFELMVSDKEDSTLINFSDPSFVNGTPYLKTNVTTKDGYTVLKWNTLSQLDAALPENGSLSYVTSIRFSVYSEKASGAVVEVGFVNPQKQGGHWSAVARICLDFTGWKSFDFHSNQISGYGCRDNTSLRSD